MRRGDKRSDRGTKTVDVLLNVDTLWRGKQVCGVGGVRDWADDAQVMTPVTLRTVSAATPCVGGPLRGRLATESRSASP